MAQWEAFLKKRSYSGHRKSRPSHCAFAPSSLRLCFFGSWAPFTSSASFLQKGGVGRGIRGASPALALMVSALPPLTSQWGGGGGTRVVASGGECDLAASSLPGVGVAGPSRSQQSPVLTRSAPPSVDSASVERDLRSRSSKVGGSSGGRSRSSQIGLSRAGGSWDGRQFALSCESRSRFTTRSRSCGPMHSRQSSSCSPSARVRSRRSQMWSSDCYRGR